MSCCTTDMIRNCNTVVCIATYDTISEIYAENVITLFSISVNYGSGLFPMSSQGWSCWSSLTVAGESISSVTQSTSESVSISPQVLELWTAVQNLCCFSYPWCFGWDTGLTSSLISSTSTCTRYSYFWFSGQGLC